jgi:signal transduction histidine kinase
MRILLAEDDRMLGSAVQRGLQQAGMTVDWVTDGPAVARTLVEGAHALLVLDLGLEIAPGTQAAALTVRLHPHALQLLLENLLDNALRHAPPGSTVDVRLARDAATVELAVVDRGPGIPAAQRARALQRFVRLPSAVGEGSGLGLSIVASIALQSEGVLVLDDTPGGGLTVRLRWPAAAAAP